MEKMHMIIIPTVRVSGAGIVRAVCGEFLLFDGKTAKTIVNLNHCVVCPNCCVSSGERDPIEITDSVFFIPVSNPYVSIIIV